MILTLLAAATFQQPLAITVLDSASRLPVTHAVARHAAAGRQAPADRLGRIRIAAPSANEVVVVHAIGYRPATLRVFADTVFLVALSTRLAEITVGADRDAAVAPSLSGQWVVPREALWTMPPAIETDPLRALAALPSISFSSPLSARPLIRGYDASQSLVRIDGFEVVNPYHLARAFSAFSADFTQSIATRPVPHRSTDGETLAGVVDLAGTASGEPGRRNGGLDLTLASASAWQGWRGGVPGFAGIRLASLNVITEAAGEKIGYGFLDGYARVGWMYPGSRRGDLTIYASRDQIGGRAPTDGMEWSNVLLGHRARLAERAGWALDADVSYNRFALSGRGVESRFSEIDFINLSERLTAGINLSGLAGAVQWQLGLRGSRRRVVNELEVLSGSGFDPYSARPTLGEAAVSGSATIPTGRAAITAGVRYDRSSTAATLQPRFRLAYSVNDRASLAVTLARAARLYQLVSDPQPEPTTSFFDFWLNAGERGTPVPSVDHLTAELDLDRSPIAIHLGLYASRGRGLAEVRPVNDNLSGMRFGDSRTAGLELRLARSPSGPRSIAFVASYALAMSERRWSDGRWRPWQLDQRHRLRLQADKPFSSRISVFALAEGRSAQPVTRVSALYYSRTLPAPGDTLAPGRGRPRYVYAEEGAHRGSPVFWLDAGARFWIHGPWRARTAVGFAVTNLTFGEVAPLEPVDPFEAVCGLIITCQPGQGPGVRYERRFSMPAIPSITLRIEF